MRSHVVQSSFLTGVIDPRASARTETEAYNNGLLVGENIRLHHLGGATRRPGMVYVDTLPNKLQLVSGGATVTAPNGGTTANAKDDSEATVFTTTTGVSTTDPYVVVHLPQRGASGGPLLAGSEDRRYGYEHRGYLAGLLQFMEHDG